MAVAGSFRGLVDLHPAVKRWAVDMPIGLASDGPRECDAIARRLLGPHRRSSVFSAPVLAAVVAGDYREACRRSFAASGRKLSLQTWGLVPKIVDVRRTLLADGRLRRRVFETHPELCFTRLAGEPLAEGKKTDAGRRRREGLLAAEFGGEAVGRLVTQAQGTRGVGVNDALDAAACWTAAELLAVDKANQAPERARADAEGLPMQILW